VSLNQVQVGERLKEFLMMAVVQVAVEDIVVGLRCVSESSIGRWLNRVDCGKILHDVDTRLARNQGGGARSENDEGEEFHDHTSFCLGWLCDWYKKVNSGELDGRRSMVRGVSGKSDLT